MNRRTHSRDGPRSCCTRTDNVTTVTQFLLFLIAAWTPVAFADKGAPVCTDIPSENFMLKICETKDSYTFEQRDIAYHRFNKQILRDYLRSYVRSWIGKTDFPQKALDTARMEYWGIVADSPETAFGRLVVLTSSGNLVVSVSFESLPKGSPEDRSVADLGKNVYPAHFGSSTNIALLRPKPSAPKEALRSLLATMGAKNVEVRGNRWKVTTDYFHVEEFCERTKTDPRTAGLIEDCDRNNVVEIVPSDHGKAFEFPFQP